MVARRVVKLDRCDHWFLSVICKQQLNEYNYYVQPIRAPDQILDRGTSSVRNSLGHNADVSLAKLSLMIGGFILRFTKLFTFTFTSRYWVGKIVKILHQPSTLNYEHPEHIGGEV